MWGRSLIEQRVAGATLSILRQTGAVSAQRHGRSQIKRDKETGSGQGSPQSRDQRPWRAMVAADTRPGSADQMSQTDMKTDYDRRPGTGA
jgi:hypothetical protein